MNNTDGPEIRLLRTWQMPKQESNLNPASFQSGQGNWNSGVGLNQWTPGTNLQTRARDDREDGLFGPSTASLAVT